MPRDLSNSDASSHATSELEYVIKREKKSDPSTIPTVSVQDAMKNERVFKKDSTRDVTRVLFISQNADLLNPTQQSLDGYVNISDLFDEVHILILRQGITPKNPVLRVNDNVWIYTAASRFWWMKPFAGIKMIEKQLEFASGFRPDLIVARDPFESAITAKIASHHYSKSSQLHILEDFTSAKFIKNNHRNFFRQFIPKYIIPRFASVRTATAGVQKMLQKKYTIPDIATLPLFQDYEHLITVRTELDLKEKYKPFVFIILFVGKLTHESTLYRAIDSARFVLRNPRVGMVVLGGGPNEQEFKKRAKILGIEKQVVFENRVDNILPYLKSANIMIVTDTDSDSEEIILKGAAAGIPMVMSRTEKRDDLFIQGESAYLCEPSDVQTFTNNMNDLLNNINLRQEFVANSQKMITEKFHQDPNVYREAYRASIEEAFFVGLDGDKEMGNEA